MKAGIATAVALLGIVLLGHPGNASEATKNDTGLVIRGGQEGTNLQSLTVEGEDRIQFEFERPELQLNLDPTEVPGLDLGSALGVLGRTNLDLITPMMQATSGSASPYVARPWLRNFAHGAVARFQPQLRDVDRWTLTVADSRGQTVATFGGKGNPPKEIAWDGKTMSGDPVVPGLTHSYVLEAFDRAGNKRNFVGPGFQVGAYRIMEAEGARLVFSGSDLLPAEGQAWGGHRAHRGSGAHSAPPILLEAASWINQSSTKKNHVRVMVTARSYEQATRLTTQVTDALRPLLLDDPARLQAITDVRPDAPADGTLRISRAASSGGRKVSKEKP
jgi:hypothetical protein